MQPHPGGAPERAARAVRFPARRPCSTLPATAAGKRAGKEKILHVDYSFPGCLPDADERRRGGSFEWLGDKREVETIIREILGNQGYDGRPSAVGPNLAFVQNRTELLQCGGWPEDCREYRGLEETLAKLEPQQYLLTIHFGFDDRARLPRLASSIETFRRPDVKLEEKPGSKGRNWQVVVHRKRCGFCDKEEEVTNTYKACARCKQMYYCCREHQVSHWAATHRAHCKPSEK